MLNQNFPRNSAELTKFLSPSATGPLLCSQHMAVFIAQLVEHCSANAEAMSGNPVEALKTKFANCLNWDYNYDDHISISSVFPQFKLTSFHVPFPSRVKMNSVNWSAPNVWVFIAQLVEHCSANAEVMGSNSIEALKFFFYNCDDHIPISIFVADYQIQNYIVVITFSRIEKVTPCSSWMLVFSSRRKMSRLFSSQVPLPSFLDDIL